MKIKFLIVFILGILSNPNYAQNSKTGNWLMYFGNQSVSKKWNVWNEVQYRNYNIIGDLQQFLLRTGIGYNISENNNNILLGYAYVYTENYIGNSSDKSGSKEHRIYQQFLTRQSFKSIVLQHRYRIEERFLPDEFQIRFRYSLALQVPLNHSSLIRNTVYLAASNEIFIKNTTSQFDRDRIYLALGYVINPYFRLEAGMMSQILESNHRNQFQIGLFNQIPILIKSKKMID